MYGQNFEFPNFKPGDMDSNHYDVNVYLYKPTRIFHLQVYGTKLQPPYTMEQKYS
jgi:hypothetical protein